MHYEILAIHGKDTKNSVTVFVYGDWYAAENSVNVNKVSDGDILQDGVDIDSLEDVDTMSTLRPITCGEELEYAIDEDDEDFFSVSDKTHNVEAMKKDWLTNNFERSDCSDRYLWTNLIRDAYTNGHKDDAYQMCCDNSVNPAVDMPDEKDLIIGLINYLL